MNAADLPDVPLRRAANQEREDATRMLADALSDGQITMSEFDERSAAAWRATYADELAPLTADLAPRQSSPAPRTSARVTGQPGGSGFSLAVFGGAAKNGTWHAAANHTSLTLFGGTEIDLRGATLESRETVINCVALFGGIDITVPQEYRVVNGGAGIFGSFELNEDASVTASQAELPDDAPVIRVRGIAGFGSVSVLRTAKK